MRGVSGDIISFSNILRNLGTIETQGYDIGVNWNSPEWGFGTLGASLQTTYVDKYKAVNGSDSGLYSTQAYDCTNIFLAAVEDGASTPEELNEFIGSYTGEGASGPIAFDEKGDITSSTIYAYFVRDGELDLANPEPIE